MLDIADRDLNTVVEQLRRLPSGARDFGCSPHDAKRRFGIDDLLLDLLVAAGMPTRQSGGEPRFDICDLHYAGLRLGTAHAYLWAISTWATSLERLDRAATHVGIRYYPQLPDDEEAAATARLPGGESRSVVLSRHVVAAEVTVERTPLPAAERLEVVRLVEEVEAMEFCLLPGPLRRPEVALDTGLCDCGVAAQLLLRRCSEEGLDARRSYGLILASPYGSTHAWVEVRLGGEWVAVDPLLMNLLRRFGGLNPDRWPVTRSPRALLCTVAHAPVNLVETADGRRVETMFVTTHQDPAESSPATPAEASREI